MSIPGGGNSQRKDPGVVEERGLDPSELCGLPGVGRSGCHGYKRESRKPMGGSYRGPAEAWGLGWQRGRRVAAGEAAMQGGAAEAATVGAYQGSERKTR